MRKNKQIILLCITFAITVCLFTTSVWAVLNAKSLGLNNTISFFPSATSDIKFEINASITGCQNNPSLLTYNGSYDSSKTPEENLNTFSNSWDIQETLLFKDYETSIKYTFVFKNYGGKIKIEFKDVVTESEYFTNQVTSANVASFIQTIEEGNFDNPTEKTIVLETRLKNKNQTFSAQDNSFTIVISSVEE